MLASSCELPCRWACQREEVVEAVMLVVEVQPMVVALPSEGHAALDPLLRA